MTVNHQDGAGCLTGRIIGVRHPCREHFVLTISFDAFPQCTPGQFVQILCRNPAALDESNGASAEPILRRPFSIGGLRRRGDECEMRIIGRVVGPGTAWLDSRQVGDAINVIGPLGRPFTTPADDCTPLLAAGGVGLPPIQWLAEVLGAAGRPVRFIYGAQSRELIPLTLVESQAIPSDGSFAPCIEELAPFVHHCAVTTDDGSCGLRGRVTDAMKTAIDAEKSAKWAVYACGPEPMLHAVAGLCAQRGIPCELALERVMGCGLATCQSCVVKVKDHAAPDGWRYALCCTEGPVFDAARLIWEHA